MLFPIGDVGSRGSETILAAASLAGPAPKIGEIAETTRERRVVSLPPPQRSELCRDEFAVPDIAVEDTHLAGEPAGMGDHFLGNGRVVERNIPSHLEGDETRLLGGKETLRRPRGELRVGPEGPLGFHDCPHRACGDVGVLFDQSLRGHERREGPVSGRRRRARGGASSPCTPRGCDLLHGTGRETFEAVRVLARVGRLPATAAHGAQYPRGRFGDALRQIAHLVRADVGLEVAFTDVGGWDTHVAQGNERGVLATRLGDFAAALAAFSRDLGDRMADVVVLTMSEFGRTVAENGNRGTDHGHTTAMLVMGGGVRGGRVYGRWPGLRARSSGSRGVTSR